MSDAHRRVPVIVRADGWALDIIPPDGGLVGVQQVPVEVIASFVAGLSVPRVFDDEHSTFCVPEGFRAAHGEALAGGRISDADALGNYRAAIVAHEAAKRNASRRRTPPWQDVVERAELALIAADVAEERARAVVAALLRGRR